MRVWKYELPNGHRFELDLPKKAVVISVGIQNKKLCIWVLVDVNNFPEIQTKKFVVLATGEEDSALDGLCRFIGTFFLGSGDYKEVYHLFEVL